MHTDVVRKDRTPVAVVGSIILLALAMIPAGVAVAIYMFFMQRYLTESWIPYADEIGLQFFPEMVRGAVAGFLTIWLLTYAFEKLKWTYEVNVVRYAALAFWGALTILVIAFSINVRGLTLDLVGVAGLIIGLCVGLWADEGNRV